MIRKWEDVITIFIRNSSSNFGYDICTMQGIK
nr:MAG TPA: hypothetical protein [Caudoviricetes sp.]